MLESVISCKHLTHFYGKRKIYEDLNFEVAPGQRISRMFNDFTPNATPSLK
jgi:ABC-2 type transport system ATP-binding protein